MRERFRILPAEVLRDPRTERLIVEQNRAKAFYQLLLAGLILMFIAMVVI